MTNVRDAASERAPAGWDEIKGDAERVAELKEVPVFGHVSHKLVLTEDERSLARRMLQRCAVDTVEMISVSRPGAVREEMEHQHKLLVSLVDKLRLEM